MLRNDSTLISMYFNFCSVTFCKVPRVDFHRIRFFRKPVHTQQKTNGVTGINTKNPTGLLYNVTYPGNMCKSLTRWVYRYPGDTSFYDRLGTDRRYVVLRNRDLYFLFPFKFVPTLFVSLF